MISPGCMRVRLKTYPTRGVSPGEAVESVIGEIEHEVEPLRLQIIAKRTNKSEDDWCFVRALIWERCIALHDSSRPRKQEGQDSGDVQNRTENAPALALYILHVCGPEAPIHTT